MHIIQGFPQVSIHFMPFCMFLVHLAESIVLDLASGVAPYVAAEKREGSWAALTLYQLRQSHDSQHYTNGPQESIN